MLLQKWLPNRQAHLRPPVTVLSPSCGTHCFHLSCLFSHTGILVRPKPYRAVLMDQDVLHRLSQPSHHAGGRPRYSLVWKLVMLPQTGGAQGSGQQTDAQQQCSISRPELWGPSTAFGSAAKADAVVRQLARKRKAVDEPPR